MAKQKKKPATKKKTAKKKPAKKKQAPKHEKAGRPTKYNPLIHPRLVEALAETGHVVEEMSELMGIAESTFYLWQAEHPEFSEAIDNGKDPVDNQVENELLKNCLSREVEEKKIIIENGKPKREETTTKQERGVVAAQKTWLRCRRPDKWGDKRELTINDGNSDRLGKYTDEELDAEEQRVARILDTDEEAPNPKGESETESS